MSSLGWLKWIKITITIKVHRPINENIFNIFLLLALFSWFLVIYCSSHLCSWTTYIVLAVTDCYYTFQQYVFSIFIHFNVTNHLLRHCTAVIKNKVVVEKTLWYVVNFPYISQIALSSMLKMFMATSLSCLSTLNLSQRLI